MKELYRGAHIIGSKYPKLSEPHWILISEMSRYGNNCIPYNMKDSRWGVLLLEISKLLLTSSFTVVKTYVWRLHRLCIEQNIKKDLPHMYEYIRLPKQGKTINSYDQFVYKMNMAVLIRYLTLKLISIWLEP